MRNRRAVGAAVLALCTAAPLAAQVPAEWRDSLVFHTFSIAALDPRTGEVGVAVTTRVPCVGNGVPWVRAGVGAVATQANTRTEYGNDLLDALARGVSPNDALRRLIAADSSAASRQVGVIDAKGRTAAHTGDRAQAWAGHRTGTNYVTQGNILVGPEVLDAVAKAFESAEGQPRHLADRLIDALAAGHALGGDRRHGLRQSAAVVVADPRRGRSRRTDGVTANINVCEHEDPVAELRRIYNSISQTLGYRTLQEFSGGDVAQLKLMLQALGYYRATEPPLDPRAQGMNAYTTDVIAAVNAFRLAEKLGGSGSPSGLVDAETVEKLWTALERAGKARAVREQLLDATAVRR
jgi:uncharacterized Ntn-hydrolase superfamily protein